MSSSHNPMKRRHAEIASFDETEEKVAPTDTTRNVMQRLLSQEELDQVARNAGGFSPLISSAFTLLNSHEVPLTSSIANLIAHFPQEGLSICESLVDLHDAKIKMSDAVINSIANPQRKIIVSHLQALHEAKIQLLEIAIDGLALAVHFSFQKDYFIAIQLLSIHELLCDNSIQELNKFLLRVSDLMLQYDNDEDEVYASDEENFEGDEDLEDLEDLVDVAKRIIETENQLIARKFDDFTNNPEESHVLPLPTDLKRLVHSFFSTRLIDADIELRDDYEKRHLPKPAL